MLRRDPHACQCRTSKGPNDKEGKNQAAQQVPLRDPQDSKTGKRDRARLETHARTLTSNTVENFVFDSLLEMA